MASITLGDYKIKIPKIPVVEIKDEKRAAGAVDISTLTESQLQAYTQKMNFFNSINRMTLLTGFAGTGKAQPLDCRVYTKSGYRLMGDIRVGDMILHPNGGEQEVLAIHPQGSKRVYEVHFSDGTKVRCCKDHLWKTYTYRDRACNRISKYKGRNKIKSSVSTTEEIMYSLLDTRGGINHKLPMPKPLQFAKNRLEIHPYVMGVLIGDGSLTTYQKISSNDSSIISRCESLLPVPYTIEKIMSASCDYSIRSNGGKGTHDIKKHLKELGLDTTSYHKHIPSLYMRSSVDDRIELLRGLMDADGTVSKDGIHVSYCTVSKLLAEDFSELVRSLGGVAKINIIKDTGVHATAYNITVNMPHDINPFWLKRKSSLVVPKSKYETGLYIVDVVATDIFEPQQCITVDSEDHLYITDTCKVTHNTFLTVKLLESLVTSRACKIAVTAPTNAAVKVLSDAADFASPSIEYMTTHKLLGLREIKTYDGKQVFVQDPNVDPPISAFDYVVVDEVSMLDDYLFSLMVPYTEVMDDGMSKMAKAIAKATNQRSVKILFVGDPYQIPPINRESSKPLNEEVQAEYGIEDYRLTEIVRQGAENPIIQLSMKMRKNIYRDRAYDFGDEVFKGDGYLTMTDMQDIDFLLDTLFNRPDFKENPDYCKVICWTRKRARSYNKRIRRYLYGQDSQIKLVVGEKLIADSPVLNELGAIIFNTNDDMEVYSFVEKDFPINNGDYNLKYYDTCVLYGVGEVKRKQYIKVIHEDSEELLAQILELLADNANSFEKGSYANKAAWEDFYALKDTFADVLYAYAVTAHKSQGRSYWNAFVDLGDMRGNRKTFERNRIVYTACTRPRNLLFLLGS